MHTCHNICTHVNSHSIAFSPPPTATQAATRHPKHAKLLRRLTSAAAASMPQIPTWAHTWLMLLPLPLPQPLAAHSDALGPTIFWSMIAALPMPIRQHLKCQAWFHAPPRWPCAPSPASLLCQLLLLPCSLAPAPHSPPSQFSAVASAASLPPKSLRSEVSA